MNLEKGEGVACLAHFSSQEFVEVPKVFHPFTHPLHNQQILFLHKATLAKLLSLVLLDRTTRIRMAADHAMRSDEALPSQLSEQRSKDFSW